MKKKRKQLLISALYPGYGEIEKKRRKQLVTEMLGPDQEWCDRGFLFFFFFNS